MNQEESAWLACAIDGEGYILIRPPHNQVKSYTFYVGVTNTNKPFLDKVVRLMGGRIYYKNYKVGQGWNKEPFMHAIVGSKRKVLPILQSVLPYLIIKKDKAEKAISMITELGLKGRWK